MKKILKISLAIFLINYSISVSSQIINHNLNVEFNIDSNSVEVVDSIEIPKKLFYENNYIWFNLNYNFKVETLDKNIEIIEVIKDSLDLRKRTYDVKFLNPIENSVVFVVRYQGKVKDEIKSGALEYARGFSETNGIISSKGIFLSGATYWVPDFDTKLLFFNLTVNLDSSWNVVSQGKRTVNKIEKDKRIVRYESPEPMDEIYLVAAEWTEYGSYDCNPELLAFLRTPDEDLAMRYIKTTEHYLKIYESLIGPYPYSKFALVENFWETGYGMPSFTLLGSRVIRFPWILHSSYPHELLHNWWGNSVYVDYEKGNWCEGITVYMADHLIKEQKGEGESYRRNTLQKFTDYVNESNDMPVKDFRSRNNPAEEAVGYGKSLMVNEMLRLRFGDEIFIKAYAKFYKDYKFQHASFDDIRKCFESLTNENLESFFSQWINRKGAPTIVLSDIHVKEYNEQFELIFKLSQVQKEETFDLLIPVGIYLEGEKDVKMEKVSFSDRERSFVLNFDKLPQRIDIDPQFNVFRRLDRNEVPPSLSQLFGSKETMIVLPESSPFLSEYKKLAETWKKTQEVQGKSIIITDDAKLKVLPKDKKVWVLGFDNKFAEQVKIPENYNKFLSDSNREKIKNLRSQGSLVYVFPNPENSAMTIGFIGTTNKNAIAGLTRKLPHYGKYSYLGFMGDAPDNNLKGNFPSLNSPLNQTIILNGKTPEISAKLISRKALSSFVK